MATTEVVTFDELGDPNAEPGTRDWALYVSNEIRKSLYDATRSTHHLETSVDLFKKHNGWQAFGYLTWDQFCYDRLQKPADEVEITIRLRSKDEFTTHNASVNLSDPGRKDGQHGKGVAHTTPFNDRGSTYLQRRMARDAPEVLQDLIDGKYDSTIAAARAAGIAPPKRVRLSVYHDDPESAGNYFASRVDREWMEAMIRAYDDSCG